MLPFSVWALISYNLVNFYISANFVGSIALTDFWWLSSKQANKYLYVELVHHRPLADEDDSPHQGFNNPCFTKITNMSKWCYKHQNINVYRSLTIWSDKSKNEALTSPFVIDIDNECGKLDDALTVTRNAIKYLMNSYKLKESDFRLFFTGHKGFNIEVFPNVLGLAGTQIEQDNGADCIRKKIINELRQKAGLVSEVGQARNLVSHNDTIIDRIHDYVRLHDSINEWIENGKHKTSSKIGLSLNELGSLSLKQIVDRSVV